MALKVQDKLNFANFGIQMKKLNLPEYPFKIQKKDSKFEIYDEFRKKYLVLTPEEWVRQHFLMYLHLEKQVPKSLMAIEKGLKVNTLNKRTDIVIYNRLGKAGIIVECKAPEVKISQDTFEQIARYNMSLQVDYLIVTNGIDHYCCKMDYKNSNYQFIEEIPSFEEFSNL